MKRNKSPHPAWAIEHRKPGTELRLINNKYYLYEVKSKWNPEKKRSVKITGKIVGLSNPPGYRHAPPSS